MKRLLIALAALAALWLALLAALTLARLDGEEEQ